MWQSIKVSIRFVVFKIHLINLICLYIDFILRYNILNHGNTDDSALDLYCVASAAEEMWHRIYARDKD